MKIIEIDETDESKNTDTQKKVLIQEVNEIPEDPVVEETIEILGKPEAEETIEILGKPEAEETIEILGKPEAEETIDLPGGPDTEETIHIGKKAQEGADGEEHPGGSLTQSTTFLNNAFKMAVVPSMIAYFTSNLALLSDGILVGRYVGVDGLAAVGLSTPIVMILTMIGGFLSCGAETLCARYIGKEDKEKAQQIYSLHIMLQVFFSVVCFIVGIFFMEPIAEILCGGERELIPLIIGYSRVYLVGAAAVLLSFAPYWLLPIDGKNRYITGMMAILGVVNIVLDIVFLCFMNMGIAGPAYASVIAYALATIYGLYKMHSGEHSFDLKMALPRKGELWELSVAGSPEFFTNLFMTLRVLTVNSWLLVMGGNLTVAQYAVVSTISGVVEAITIGIPQSGAAIMGIYCGEDDNPSVLILIKQQLRVALISSIIATLAIGFGSPGIAWVYEVGDMGISLWMLGVSLFPVTFVNVITTYYRCAGREMLSNVLITFRTYVFCIISFVILKGLGASPWIFMVSEALMTILLWVVLTRIIQLRTKDKPLSRWFLMDKTMEDNGNSINFSSTADNDAICDASAKIEDFCSDNDMDPQQIMTVSLALEEMMVLITEFNPGTDLTYDVRVFAPQGMIGIRIRYGGVEFNPLADEYEEDERFMGVQLVRGLAQKITHQRTFGVNSLLIVL